MKWATTAFTLSNTFVRAELSHIRTELLESINRVERAAMTSKSDSRSDHGATWSKAP